MSIYLSIVAGYLACAASLVFTWWVRRLAEKNDFVDRPDGRRKTHKQPVALGGGLVLLLSCAVALGGLLYIYGDIALERLESPSSLAGLGVAALLLCLVGLLDDLTNMRGVFKLLWQLVAASLIVTLGDGLSIEKIELPGYHVELGLFGIPLAMFWIVAAVNSVNLIDGMDGLATTVGFIFSIALGVMALITRHDLDAIIAFGMAGALLGFLRYNLPPAKIYLGDSGSMLIGVVLGTLALRCQSKEATTIAIAAPLLAMWAIPILDSAAALMRRKLTGRSMYATDRGHIHHRLLTRGLSSVQALALIALLCTITSVGAIASLATGKAIFGLAAIGLVMVLLVGTRIFGHSELMLLNNHLIGFGRSLVNADHTKSSSIRLQGSLDWETVWQGLVESAERFNLCRIRLNLHLPQLHEDFFGTWQQRENDKAVDRKWSMEIPLTVDDDVVGFLYVSGIQSTGSSRRVLADFAEFIEPLESQLRTVVATETQPASDAEETDGLVDMEDLASMEVVAGREA